MKFDTYLQELNKIATSYVSQYLFHDRIYELRFNHEDLKRHLETQLIKYLNKYLKKDFHMNPIFKSIKSKLKNKEEITDKQFESIIKFIERELPFRG